MGLLDDAIREHLELKRRRGADPGEIERSEQEALGPVRRAPEELDPAEFDPQTGVDELDEYEYEYEDGDDQEHEAGYPEDSPLPPHDYEAEPPEYEPRPPAHDPLANDEPPTYHEPLEDDEPPTHEEPTAFHEPLADDEQPSYDERPSYEEPTAYHEPPAPYQAPDAEPPGQATVEYELEEHLEGGEYVQEEPPEPPETAEPREGEDVLEETPEFLQDTPEHDRLWFEQRPPRDFDFDG